MPNETKADQYTGNELFPPEGHPRVGYRVVEILAEILQNKNDLGLPAKWIRNYELAKNRHWRNSTKKAPLVTANLLHSHRLRTVNTLTDNSPTFNVAQVGEVDDPAKEDVFETLLRTCEFWWGDTEQQSVFETSVLNGEMYGSTFEKVIFNPDLEAGLGEVETLTIDPFYIGWYPVKCHDLQKAHAIMHFYPMSVREARWRWPGKAEEITSDDEAIKALGDTRAEVKANSLAQDDQGYFTSIGSAIKQVLSAFGTGAGSRGATELKEECLVIECWVKDRSGIYSGDIRCVTVTNGGKVVLDDKDNPSVNPMLDQTQAAQTYLYHRFPFAKAQSHTDTGHPWGMSDFEQLEMLNIEINKTISQLTMVKDRVARIKLINPKDTGVSNNEFTNAPGIINPSNALVSQAIRYLDPPSINPELFKVLDIYQSLFFQVAGSFELESADATGKNVIAYKAIAALLERAATMLRGKIRNYTRMVRERGRMYLSHVMNWYTEERFISYEVDGEGMTKAIRGTDMLLPAKLSVVSGSTMPVSQVQQREEALALFDKGAIDAEELLKKLNWKQYKDVIKRIKSGPIGEFLEKLSIMGFPQPLIQGLQEIATMEMDDFEKALQNGEIPTLPQLLSAQSQYEGGPTPAEQGEIELSAAKAEVERANAELVREKVNTERVIQQTKIAGMKFDKEKLAQDRALAIAKIRADKENRALQQAESGRKDRETGIKAKSLGVKEDKPKTPEPAKAAQDRFQNPQGSYVEKGMESNNENVR
jgi:hypothetical protein